MNIQITIEQIQHHESVEQLTAEAFGPGRFARTAFRLRENVPHEPDLSFVVHVDDNLVGSVKLTRIKIGGEDALLLGPLVVAPSHKNSGIGKMLMETSVAAAQKTNFGAILLVGDLPYYERFGFEKVSNGKIRLPGPADPDRILICPLKSNVSDKFHGVAERYPPN